MVPLHEPGQLGFPGQGDAPDPLAQLLQPYLVKQGHVQHGNLRPGLFQPLQFLTDAAQNHGLHQRVQPGALFRVAENGRAQGPAVQGAVGVKHPRAKGGPDARQRLAPRGRQLPGKHIPVDNLRPQLTQGGGHVALAAGNAPVKPSTSMVSPPCKCKKQTGYIDNASGRPFPPVSAGKGRPSWAPSPSCYHFFRVSRPAQWDTSSNDSNPVSRQWWSSPPQLPQAQPRQQGAEGRAAAPGASAAPAAPAVAPENHHEQEHREHHLAKADAGILVLLGDTVPQGFLPGRGGGLGNLPLQPLLGGELFHFLRLAKQPGGGDGLPVALAQFPGQGRPQGGQGPVIVLSQELGLEGRAQQLFLALTENFSFTDSPPKKPKVSSPAAMSSSRSFFPRSHLSRRPAPYSARVAPSRKSTVAR